MQKPLTDEDYDAQHKFSFDMCVLHICAECSLFMLLNSCAPGAGWLHRIGNELTPSARYDFKFKDYAPWVFRDLREHFLLDPADYLVSLTAKYILSELGSPGKSGSFFYFSRDYRFIIKTIHRSEHKFLRKILRQYHDHVKSNPHTLISRFYGLHRVKLPRGRKIHFVIMNNLMPPHRDVHETYDLKGSTVSREYPEDKAALNPRATLKDLNWLHRGKVLELGPDKRALLFEQLKNDTAFLQKLGIMDYSLLLGIHDMGRGNKDKIREGALTVFDVSFFSDPGLLFGRAGQPASLIHFSACLLANTVHRSARSSFLSPTMDSSCGGVVQLGRSVTSPRKLRLSARHWRGPTRKLYLKAACQTKTSLSDSTLSFIKTRAGYKPPTMTTSPCL